MSNASTVRKPSARRASQRIAADGNDLVDTIFEFLATELGSVDPAHLQQLKAATRAKFAGEKVWVNRRDQAARDALAAEVLNRFHRGLTASEIARMLQIGRATVYRILSQAGKG